MEQPFTTNCRPLAFALALAGCPFDVPEKDTPEERDKSGPAINRYSLEFLRQPGMQKHWEGRKLKPREAIEILIRKRIPGKVEWVFKRCAIQAEVCEAFGLMGEEFQLAESEGREPVLPDIPARIIAQVVYVASRSEDAFKELAFLNRMRQMCSSVVTRQVGEGRYEGSGKDWSAFGSKKLTDHLKV